MIGTIGDPFFFVERAPLFFLFFPQTLFQEPFPTPRRRVTSSIVVYRTGRRICSTQSGGRCAGGRLGRCSWSLEWHLQAERARHAEGTLGAFASRRGGECMPRRSPEGPAHEASSEAKGVCWSHSASGEASASKEQCVHNMWWSENSARDGSKPRMTGLSEFQVLHCGAAGRKTIRATLESLAPSVHD